MKYVIILLCFIVCSACSHTDYQKFSYTNSENPWIDAFKDQAFIACLKESYSNDSIFKMIEKQDTFNPYDGLSLNELALAQQKGTAIAKNIPAPALCENCNKGENYFMATCLHYYKSKELDSIAHDAYNNRNR